MNLCTVCCVRVCAAAMTVAMIIAATTGTQPIEHGLVKQVFGTQRCHPECLCVRVCSRDYDRRDDRGRDRDRDRDRDHDRRDDRDRDRDRDRDYRRSRSR